MAVKSNAASNPRPGCKSQELLCTLPLSSQNGSRVLLRVQLVVQDRARGVQARSWCDVMRWLPRAVSVLASQVSFRRSPNSMAVCQYGFTEPAVLLLLRVFLLCSPRPDLDRFPRMLSEACRRLVEDTSGFGHVALGSTDESDWTRRTWAAAACLALVGRGAVLSWDPEAFGVLHVSCLLEARHQPLPLLPPAASQPPLPHLQARVHSVPRPLPVVPQSQGWRNDLRRSIQARPTPSEADAHPEDEYGQEVKSSSDPTQGQVQASCALLAGILAEGASQIICSLLAIVLALIPWRVSMDEEGRAAVTGQREEGYAAARRPDVNIKPRGESTKGQPTSMPPAQKSYECSLCGPCIPHRLFTLNRQCSPCKPCSPWIAMSKTGAGTGNHEILEVLPFLSCTGKTEEVPHQSLALETISPTNANVESNQLDDNVVWSGAFESSQFKDERFVLLMLCRVDFLGGADQRPLEQLLRIIQSFFSGDFGKGDSSSVLQSLLKLTTVRCPPLGEWRQTRFVIAMAVVVLQLTGSGLARTAQNHWIRCLVASLGVETKAKSSVQGALLLCTLSPQSPHQSFKWTVFQDMIQSGRLQCSFIVCAKIFVPRSAASGTERSFQLHKQRYLATSPSRLHLLATANPREISRDAPLSAQGGTFCENHRSPGIFPLLQCRHHNVSSTGASKLSRTQAPFPPMISSGPCTRAKDLRGQFQATTTTTARLPSLHQNPDGSGRDLLAAGEPADKASVSTSPGKPACKGGSVGRHAKPEQRFSTRSQACCASESGAEKLNREGKACRLTDSSFSCRQFADITSSLPSYRTPPVTTPQQSTGHDCSPAGSRNESFHQTSKQSYARNGASTSRDRPGENFRFLSYQGLRSQSAKHLPPRPHSNTCWTPGDSPLSNCTPMIPKNDSLVAEIGEMTAAVVEGATAPEAVAAAAAAKKVDEGELSEKKVSKLFNSDPDMLPRSTLTGKLCISDDGGNSGIERAEFSRGCKSVSSIDKKTEEKPWIAIVSFQASGKQRKAHILCFRVSEKHLKAHIMWFMHFTPMSAPFSTVAFPLLLVPQPVVDNAQEPAPDDQEVAVPEPGNSSSRFTGYQETNPRPPIPETAVPGPLSSLHPTFIYPGYSLRPRDSRSTMAPYPLIFHRHCERVSSGISSSRRASLVPSGALQSQDSVRVFQAARTVRNAKFTPLH